MFEIGVQTHNAISDDNPSDGFKMLAGAGFDCCDFSLNYYFKNKSIYAGENNRFFDKSIAELEEFFAPHVKAARESGVRIHQMHMPYPNYVPGASEEFNDYLIKNMAPKSMELCHFYGCKYIVMHGLKVKQFYGSEEAEWEATVKVIDTLAPMAKEMGIVICVENLYNSVRSKLVEGPCCNAEKAARRIDEINDRYGAEVLGFCFDTGHANLVGIDFESFLKTLAHRIKVLHIHDNDGISDLHQIPFTFTRNRENHPSTDWDGFIRGLKAIDYKGVLNFETAPVLSAFPKEMKADTLSFIAKIGRYFSERLEE